MSKIKGKQITPNFTETVTAPEIVATVKYFSIDHPTIPNKKLIHSCLEGGEIAIYLRGKSNSNFIEFPDYFKALVVLDSITVNITPIGNNYYSVSVNEITKDGIHVSKLSDGYYFYYIIGVRNDVPELNIVGDVSNFNPIKKPFYKKIIKWFKNIFELFLFQ